MDDLNAVRREWKMAEYNLRLQQMPNKKLHYSGNDTQVGRNNQGTLASEQSKSSERDSIASVFHSGSSWKHHISSPLANNSLSQCRSKLLPVISRGKESRQWDTVISKGHSIQFRFGQRMPTTQQEDLKDEALRALTAIKKSFSFVFRQQIQHVFAKLLLFYLQQPYVLYTHQSND